MISKKTIRTRVRQRMGLHPNSYAHEHIAPVARETGQSEEVVKNCLLEGVVMTAYALHLQPLSTYALDDAVQRANDDEKFIATQAKRLASFGVTAELARMAVEQFASEMCHSGTQ